MNKARKITITLVLTLVITLLVTGCGGAKKEDLKFDGKKGTVTFTVNKDAGYKLSTKADDFRTSREQGMIIGKDFSIGIEFSDDLDYFHKGDFKAFKEEKKDNEEFKEVTYSDIKGIQYFYSGYMRYEIILPIEGNNKYTLNLTVYGKDETEKDAQTAIKSEEVKAILNGMKDIKVK